MFWYRGGGLLVIDGGAIGRCQARAARTHALSTLPNERQLYNARDAKCRYTSCSNFIVICAYLSCEENYGSIIVLKDIFGNNKL